MKININKETITNELHKGFTLLKKGVKVVAPIIIMGVLSSNEKKETSYHPVYVTGAKYGDAITAIVSSDMFSSDKSKAVAALPKGEDDQFYIGVISVVKSDMFSSSKLSSILNMIK